MIRALALSLIVLAGGPPVFGQPGLLPQGQPRGKNRPHIKLAPRPEPLEKLDADRPRVPKYVRFDIEDNPEQMLADFLKSKAGQGLIKKMLGDDLQKLLDQPPRDIERLIKEKAGRPAFREFIEEFLKENPGVREGRIGGDNLRDVVKKFGEKAQDDPAFIEAIAKKMSTLFKDDAPDLPKLRFDNDPLELPDLKKMVEDKSLDERFGEWFKDWLTEDRQQQILDVFKETPVLQDALVDLARSLRSDSDPRLDSKWLPKMPEAGKWKMDLKPPKLPWDLGQMPKLPTFKLPTPPRIDIPLPKIAPIHMPQFPNFGAAPGLPEAPRVGGSSEWLTLAGCVFGLVLGYFFLRRFRWGRGAESEAMRQFLARLPAEIQTRTDLRRAFDLFALSRLGEKARPWNHRQIAGQLGDSDPSRLAAQAFAHLYEIARYTPGDERLSADERNAVHQSLATLTGAAA